MDSDEGSMLVGHSASRKLGGPEMYSVARRAFTAGEPGKRIAKARVVKDEGACACSAALAALSCCTIGHVYIHRVSCCTPTRADFLFLDTPSINHLQLTCSCSSSSSRLKLSRELDTC